MATEAPYGTWRSPISAADLATAGVRLSEVRADGADLYWIERRPQEAGRNALVRRDADGRIADVLPAGWSARTTVHEYGGGSYAVRDGTIVFANYDDQRLYLLDGRHTASEPRPLTPEPRPPGSVRFADMTLDASGRVAIAVRETHTEHGVSNDLVAISVSTDTTDTTDTTVTTLVAGSDFYSSPRNSPGGDRLAWLTWDHPQMPWDGTELWVADIATTAEPPTIANAIVVAGGPTESIVQPEWSPGGVLHFVSDRTGWWNLYSTDRQSLARDAEFAGPHWVFGLSYYAFLGDGRIATAYTEGGQWHLAIVDPTTRELHPLTTPYTDISYVTVAPGRVAGDHDYDRDHDDDHEIVYVGGSATEPPVIATTSTTASTDHTTRVIRRSQEPPDPAYVSVPEAIEFSTTGDATAHAFFYRPTNAEFRAPDGERPPLLVIGHGGPTSSTRTTHDAAIQFWTTRGIAVVDVNYRGSTGYGRAYRDALRGNWGVADVDDCVAAARHLVERGEADGHRLLIRGGSAGGYTVLRALTTTDEFAAAASYFGVADLEVLAKETHKFEARYLDGLVAPYPEGKDVYAERSPIHVADRITAPLLVLQGRDDRVVPPWQSEMIVDALRRSGVPVAYLEFEGEGHGFRQAATLVRAAESELWFYGRILGFAPADDIAPVHVVNRAS